ncbi:uncharacterized protein topaz1 isoform X13 [Xyrichtys novacula]|uniref:Protein TOPAZ1 n=1 Tax=Xyrichtys novacula TaxID=13765 RepID=A0AAV1HD99_XYRNO|nr:uncharacterized protein topaz1 isoform X13 [Xyrichtys novacula]
MLPTSRRVKLNRVAFKHLVAPGLVPRRRRVRKCVDSDRHTHQIPAGPSDPEGSFRRVPRASGGGVCGDYKYRAHKQKTLGKQEQKSRGPEQGRPTVDFMLEGKNTAPEASQKIVVGIDQCPKVTLCDIAQYCDTCNHKCGYVIPDVLKTKVVHCFKQEMRAGFRLSPGCFDHIKKETKKDVHANGEVKNVLETRNLTPHQNNISKSTNLQIFSNHTPCCVPERWTSEGSGSSLLLSDKHIEQEECRTGMKDRKNDQNPGSKCLLTGAGLCRDKRRKLADGVEDGTSPSTSDLESTTKKQTTKTDKEKGQFWTSDNSPEHVQGVGSSSIIGLEVTKNGVSGPHRGECSPELLCQSDEMDTDEPESSFTCQRVRIYKVERASSCARTHISWPFSKRNWTLTAHVGTASQSAEHVDPLLRGYCDSTINQHQSDLSSERTNDVVPASPTDFSTGVTTHHISHQIQTKREDEKCILAQRNGTIQGDQSSYSSVRKDMHFAPPVMEAEESQASLSDETFLSNSSQCGVDTVSLSSLPANDPKTNSSLSTPSPTALGLSDWNTAPNLSPMLSPFLHCGSSRTSVTPSSLTSVSLLDTVRNVELAEDQSTSTLASLPSPAHVVESAEKKPPLDCEESQMTRCHKSDSFPSFASSFSLAHWSDEFFTGRLPPKLEPYYKTRTINHNLTVPEERSLDGVLKENCVDDDFLLPPVLSPVTSPTHDFLTSFLLQSPEGSDEDEEEIHAEPSQHRTLPGVLLPQIVNGNNENFEDDDGQGSKQFESQTSLNESHTPHVREETNHHGTDDEAQVTQVMKKTEQIPADTQMKPTLSLGSQTNSCSSLCSEEDDSGAFSDEGPPPREAVKSPCGITDSERDVSKAEAAEENKQGVLDEFTAYEQDILLVDVSQDDPDLFNNLPQESLLKLGPTRLTEASNTKPGNMVKAQLLRKDRASVDFEQRLTTVMINFHCDSPDISDEGNRRSWRPQSSSSSSSLASRQSISWTAKEKPMTTLRQPDANNNHVNGDLKRSQPIQTVTFQPSQISAPMTKKNGPWNTNLSNMAEFRHQLSNTPQYCRQYFSESMSCGFKMCWFLHVPVDGDEKFCVETVARFTKNPMCLQRAGAVFTGYYQNNPPKAHFSMPVLLSLLWALLRAGMVSDIFSILHVSVAHKILPGHEFVLALFNFVREKGLLGLVPELMQLTFKMAGAGLGLSLDCLDCVKNTPEFQMKNSNISVSGNQKLSTSGSFSEYLNLAHAVVEIELCTKQEDWRRMGEVFRSICQSSQGPNQVKHISGRIAIALLSEGKDKLSLPFAAFAETVCQNEEKGSLNKSFFGRIGVSLMLRYHKTHQWAKGRKVVEVLSNSKVNYSTLKGLFGNEDGASRCYLITVATELFLLSGSVEGALNTLRENTWFVSSCAWPCEPADLESRIHVLIRLAEKSSHRDTLDVLSNLPGLKEPSDLTDNSRYASLFNSHLQVCLDKQTLTVASDTVDFMLSKNLSVDHTMLHVLLHKLGKQNLWLRAREVFRRSLGAGYYPGVSAQPGFLTLIIPCRLGEVELGLTLEMFITVNATVLLHLPENTTSCLSITLKRIQSCESEYLSAGSRLLSAAGIPQPKLIIQYKAVNSSQEQVFTLDISSARFWLRHNHLWANEVWTH